MRDITPEALKNFAKYSIVGGIAGFTIPFFVTLLQLYYENQYVNWTNIVYLHSTYPWYVVVDVLPFIAGITTGVLGDFIHSVKGSYEQIIRRHLELEDSYRFFKQLLEDSPMSCMVVDKSFNTLYINQVALDLVNCRREDAIGKTCYLAMGQRTVCSSCPVVTTFQTGQIQKAVRDQILPSGKKCSLEITAVPLFQGETMFGVMEIKTNVSEQMELIAEKKRDLLATIDTLIGLIELKDSYTGGHSQRVRTWAVAIAEALRLSPTEVEDIEIAACLHDIGKIGISGAILNKPDRLTSGEYEFIKKHPLIGETTVRSIERLQNVSKIIRHHHEFYNGLGYPDGLAGETIPLGSRVICVADAYDAMMSDRAYRSALGRDKAVEQLKQGVHQQFDQQVVNVFLQLLKEEQVV